MTYTEFKNKWLGRGIDYDGKYQNQCVDVYRMYCKEVLNVPQSPPVVGAKNIWDSYLNEYFERIPNTPEGVPAQGDVVIWGHGTYGHVGICDSADINQVTCFEQNWVEMDGSGVTELRKHTYKDILGWLKPISITQNMTNYRGYDLENLESMKVAVDVLVQLQSGELVRKEDLANIVKDLEALKKTVKELEVKVDEKDSVISELKDNISIKDELIADYQSRLDSANEQIATLSDEKSKYRRLYEQLLENSPEKMSILSVLSLLFGKIIAIKLKG